MLKRGRFMFVQITRSRNWRTEKRFFSPICVEDIIMLCSILNSYIRDPRQLWSKDGVGTPTARPGCPSLRKLCQARGIPLGRRQNQPVSREPVTPVKATTGTQDHSLFFVTS